MALSPVRSRTILDAAHALFTRHGARHTSMEAIAANAGIAKPTLYAYFADKPAIVAALLDRLAAAWRDEARGALQADGGVVQRVAAALTAHGKARWRLWAQSPDAATIYGAEGASRFAQLEAELATAIERALAEAGAERPRLVAQLLLAASDGICRRAQSPAELGPALRLLAERLIAPELPR